MNIPTLLVLYMVEFPAYATTGTPHTSPVARAALSAWATSGAEGAACQGALGAHTRAGGARRANNMGTFETEGSEFKLF
jgi:hypothetical protein